MDDYAEAAHVAVELLADHVTEARAGLGPANVQPDPDALAAELDLERWIEEGGMDAAALEEWLPRYLEATVRLHHPGSMAHQVAVPSTGAAVADVIHGATNNPMAIYEMGAAGATIEREIVRWMLDKVGFDRESGGGVLTHGGSFANLTALLAARARVAPDAWRAGTPGDLALLAPASAHYSIRRAAAILGLGEAAVVELEVDELERIRPDRLAAALERCTQTGRRPLALVAPACATSTGLYDDLRAIGASAPSTASGCTWTPPTAPPHSSPSATAGSWTASSSQTPSSGTRTRCCGRRACAPRSWCDAAPTCPPRSARAATTSSTDTESVGFDLLDRALETTKTTLGLKLFLSLAWAGERGLGEYVASRYDTARRFHELLSREPDVTLPYVPESNIVCFRIGDGDQLALRERVLEGGRLHFGSTTVNGERYLRLVVTAPDTNEETLGELLRGLRNAPLQAVA